MGERKAEIVSSGQRLLLTTDALRFPCPGHAPSLRRNKRNHLPLEAPIKWRGAETLLNRLFLRKPGPPIGKTAVRRQ